MPIKSKGCNKGAWSSLSLNRDKWFRLFKLQPKLIAKVQNLQASNITQFYREVDCLICWIRAKYLPCLVALNRFDQGRTLLRDKVDQKTSELRGTNQFFSFSEALPKSVPLYINLDEVFIKLNLCTNSVNNTARVFIKDITPEQLKQKLKTEEEFKQTRNKHFFELDNVHLNIYTFDPDDKDQKHFKLVSNLKNCEKVLNAPNIYDPGDLFNIKRFYINTENTPRVTNVVLNYNAFMADLCANITSYIKATPNVCHESSLDLTLFDKWYVKDSYPQSMSLKFVKLADRLYEDKDYLAYQYAQSNKIAGLSDWMEKNCWDLEVQYQCAKRLAVTSGLSIHFIFVVNAIKNHLQQTNQILVYKRFTSALSIWIQKAFFLQTTSQKPLDNKLTKQEYRYIKDVNKGTSKPNWSTKRSWLFKYLRSVFGKNKNLTIANCQHWLKIYLKFRTQKRILKYWHWKRRVLLKQASWKFISPKVKLPSKFNVVYKLPLGKRNLGYFLPPFKMPAQLLKRWYIDKWRKRIYWKSCKKVSHFLMWPYIIQRLKRPKDTLKISFFYSSLKFYVSLKSNKELRVILPLDHWGKILWQKTIKNLVTCYFTRRQIWQQNYKGGTCYQHLRETLNAQQHKYLSRLGMYALFFQKLRYNFVKTLREKWQFLNFFKLYNLYFFFFLINYKNIIQMYLFILLNLWLRFFYIVLNNNVSNKVVNVLFFEVKKDIKFYRYTMEIESQLISQYASKFIKEFYLINPSIIKGQVQQLYLTLFKNNLKILYLFLCKKNILLTKNQVDMNLLDIFFFKSYKCRSVYNPYKNVFKLFMIHKKEHFLFRKNRNMRWLRKKVVKHNSTHAYRMFYGINSKKKFKKISSVYNWKILW